MGKLFKQYLSGKFIYACATCHSHLSSREEIVSTAFRGRTGRAFLFGRVINVDLGPKERRDLTTGGHVVCDLFCRTCHKNVGWKYEQADDETQKYKEGKFCVETALMSSLRDGEY